MIVSESSLADLKSFFLAQYKKGDLGSSLALLNDARLQHPSDEDLLGLSFHVFREQNDADAAATILLDFLLQYTDSKRPLEWLSTTVSLLVKRDEVLLEKMSRLSSLEGRALYVRALVACRHSIEAFHELNQLNLTYPGQEVLTFEDFGDLLSLGELFEEARQAYWKALEAFPQSLVLVRKLVETCLSLAEVGFSEYLSEGLDLSNELFEIAPESPEALLAMGKVWRSCSRMDLAYEYLDRYFQLCPDDAFRNAHAFDSLYAETVSYEKILKGFEEWSETLHRLTKATRPASTIDWSPDRKIRLGFVSADFGNHPVGFFFWTVLKNHDSRKFEIFLYAQRDPVGENDELCQQFQNFVGPDHFRWTTSLSNERILECVRSDKIDILVDLAGHSKNNRMDLFLNRGAPVQVSWLGHPGTTMSKNMDFRITDAIVEPEGYADKLSSEKIVRLPKGFHAIEMPRNLPEPSDAPCLKNGFLTFGSFNNAKKIGHQTIELWSSVLKAIPTARLILKHKTMEVFYSREFLKSQFIVNGIDPMRIEFVGVTHKREDHFRHYENLDIALDPYTYNGTTTTCEALYMGVPVLTLPGKSHPSRVSASLLHQLGMDGWIARDKEHYIRIGQAAAHNFDALQKRRMQMREDFLKSSLSNGVQLAHNLESAYRAMWKTACALYSHSRNYN